VGYRAFVTLVGVMIFLLMEACRFVVFNRNERWLLGSSLLLFVCIQFLNKDNLNAQMGRNWVPSTLQPIGEALKERYGNQQPLVALFTAGAIPYYSGLPTLDVYGLNDRTLTHKRHENKDFGHGLVGHDLFDADYVESRKPDLLLFDIPGIKSQCANKQVACDSLYKHYKPTTLETSRYHITVWERKDSKKLER
jgi:arabinofuranosyltransferase